MEKDYVKDLLISSDFEILFPDDYVNNVSERLNLYNELSNVKNEEELMAYEQKLIDRFGPLPKPAISLLNSIRIKWIATKIGIEKLVMKQGKMIGYFIADQQSSFYQSDKFLNLIQFVAKHPTLCKLKEKQTSGGLKLLLTFDNVRSIRKALEVMNQLKL